jgi:DNA-binding SARP family transcriptional activator
MQGAIETSRTSVRLLGCFQLSVGSKVAHLPLQAQRVVAYLAVSDRPTARQKLAERLWPYNSERRAHANLRTALWRVRQKDPNSVETDRELVQLDRDVLVDYRAISAADMRTPSVPFLNLDSDIVAHLRNDLLPGWDEEWLMIERERACQLRMRLLESVSRNYLSDGNTSAAIDAAYASIEIEPLRESAHLALIEAHVVDGNLAEAAHQATRLADLVQHELGISPSVQFQDRLTDLGLAMAD